MEWKYGNPAAGTSPERPPCWGLSYDNDNRECQTRCAFRESCRQEVQRKINAQRLAPQAAPPPYPPVPQYGQPAPMMPQYGQQPVQVPVPVQIPIIPPQPPAPRVPGYGVPPPPQPPQPPRPPAQAGPVPQAQAAQQQAYGPIHFGVYGAINDPLHTGLHSAAGPFRPQMPGETFLERWFKNMLLNGLEAVAKEVVLGIRQMWLPPVPPTQPNTPPSAQVVDAYPPKH